MTLLRDSGSGFASQRLRTRRKGEKLPPGDDDDWRSVFQGVVFSDNGTAIVSEGNSGRVRAIDTRKGTRLWTLDLNSRTYQDSYSGDLALDRQRGLLYVVDQANFRIAVIRLAEQKVVASIRTGRLPFAVALSPDARRLYVTNIGMFEYSAVPGADPKRARESGLPFPAFGFPSPESRDGAMRTTGSGNSVRVPGLGDPNVQQANSVSVMDVSNAEHPRHVAIVRTGLPFGAGIWGGSSPSGVLATDKAVFVSNAHNDSITVLDAATFRQSDLIRIRIPGLEAYRGVLPIGMALVPEREWLLVAQAGINAIGVIDIKASRFIGHIPTAWFPTRIAVHGGHVFVANAKGFGTGPNAGLSESFQADLRKGAVTAFPLPSTAELAALTQRVMENNGFVRRDTSPAPLPRELKHVVLIVKENRTFDEVFGNGARFGARVTPNHHEIARRWAISDNFYADSEVSVDGHHWIVGSYPNAWTESSLMAAYGGQKDFRLPTAAPGRLIFAESNSSVHPEEQLEAGIIWHHLERHGISFRNFGEGFELAGVNEGEGLKPTGARYLTNVPMPDPLYRNTSRTYPQYNMNIPDQYRADQFIADLKNIDELPRFIFVHLPNDHTAKARPKDGYPAVESYVADNDLALGRILEYLSGRPEWKRMAVFVTEDDAQGGVDSIDSHRTVLMIASPYAKRGYVSHRNSSFPGLLKTVFRILQIPPLNLYDAAATDLADCFGSDADAASYRVQPVDPRIFDPAKAREPLDPEPSVRMDDPAALRDQHRRR